MIDRRGAIRFAMAAFAAASLLPSRAARAQQSFQRFVPLLVELQGWKGNKPDGMAMEMGGTSMVTAGRQYERGEARLQAQILQGAPAQGVLAATQSGLKIETGDSRMSTSTIDGLQVTQTYTISNKSGAILVALGPSAAFTVSFNGIGDDEALRLAKAFNWKAIQAQLK